MLEVIPPAWLSGLQWFRPWQVKVDTKADRCADSSKLLCWIATYISWRLFFDGLHRIPGPTLWALTQAPWHFNNLRGRLFRELEQLHLQYGPVVRIGPNEVSVTATERETWRKIYAAKPEEMLKDLSGTGAQPAASGKPGLFQANTSDHARMRLALQPAFLERALREQEDVLLQHIGNFVRKTGEFVDKRVNIGKLFNLATFDIISNLTFGESFGGLETGDYHPWVRTIFAQIRVVPIVQLLLSTGLVKYLALLSPKKIQDEREVFWAMTRDKVDRRLEKSNHDRKDLISLLNPDDIVDRRELYQNAAAITIAGSETSGKHLASVIFFLLTHPEHKEKLLQEVHSSFKEASDIRMASVAGLKYLSCVIQESLRMYPPAPGATPRIVHAAGEIIEGWPLPPGTTVGIPMWSTYRAPVNFYNPSKFDPRRWMRDCPPEYKDDHREAVQPFAYGNRNCIGQR